MATTGNLTKEILTQKVTIDSNLADKEYTLVAFDSTDELVVNAATTGAAMSFVLTEAGNGATTPVLGTIVLGGVTKVKLGGSVSAGASVVPTTGGAAIATTTDGDFCPGIVLVGGSSGDIVPFLVAPHVMYTA